MGGSRVPGPNTFLIEMFIERLRRIADEQLRWISDQLNDLDAKKRKQLSSNYSRYNNNQQRFTKYIFDNQGIEELFIHGIYFR